MSRFITSTVFFLSLLVLYSCGSSKNMAGTYRSRFAELGFFETTIKLKSDSTFEYGSRGDLMYDSGTGRYKIHGGKVYLIFDKVVPGLNNMFYFSSASMPEKEVVASGDIIRYQKYYYTGHNKLFQAHHETGKKVTKAHGYSKRKKYLLFGSHYYDRRYYYQRVI